MSTLDWVVVGGGPHGVCAARALRAAGADVKIVDPNPALLGRWSRRARSVAMRWMRSPVVHHLDAHPTDLHHFLHDPANSDVEKMARPYLRPRHAAFMRHSKFVIARDGLSGALVRGCVNCVRADGPCLVVEGEELRLRTRRVLVATGSNRLRLPDWAATLQAEGGLARHVFEAAEHFDTDIVGGGISAVQRALLVGRRTRKKVRLWVRRPIDIAEFDTDQEATKARGLGRWTRLDERQRLHMLRHRPARGSVTPALWSRFSGAVRKGQIEIHTGPMKVVRPDSKHRLLLSSGERTVESSGLTLATGFVPEQVGGWVGDSARRLGLPFSEGLPRLQSDMHWGRGVYVSGPLARLRLGQMASNVVGGRWATSLLPGVKMHPY